MTLRDFLKVNKSLTSFKKMYHEQSKTKITYRQIEANLLTAGEDFIINALNISNTDCDYWVGLNTKWNNQLNFNNKTLSYWLEKHHLKEKFKNEYLKQHPGNKNKLDQIFAETNCCVISCAFKWASTSDGYDFWGRKSTEWAEFCRKK